VIAATARQPRLSLVALVYTALAAAFTWPLVLGLGRDVPGDMGDSLLNMWILEWGAQHAPQLLTGRLSWEAFWNATPVPLDLHPVGDRRLRTGAGPDG